MQKHFFGGSPEIRPNGITPVSLPNDELGPMESFVTAQEAANFLAVTKRRILELARQGRIPAHPLGDGMRKTWRFRLSEIAESLDSKQKGQVA